MPATFTVADVISASARIIDEIGGNAGEVGEVLESLGLDESQHVDLVAFIALCVRTMGLAADLAGVQTPRTIVAWLDGFMTGIATIRSTTDQP